MDIAILILLAVFTFVFATGAIGETNFRMRRWYSALTGLGLVGLILVGVWG